MAFDRHNSTFVTPALNPQTIATNTTTNGPIIDTSQGKSVEFILQSGTITDGTYTPIVTTGDDPALADGAAVAASEFLGGGVASATFVATDDNVCKRIGLKKFKRYVRLGVASTGVTTGGPLGASCEIGSALIQPTPN